MRREGENLTFDIPSGTYFSAYGVRAMAGGDRRAPVCYGVGVGKLSPIESEFDSTEEAEAYQRWFGAKVQASLADTRPSVPHETVMAEVDALIAEAERGSPGS